MINELTVDNMSQDLSEGAFAFNQLTAALGLPDAKPSHVSFDHSPSGARGVFELDPAKTECSFGRLESVSVVVNSGQSTALPNCTLAFSPVERGLTKQPPATYTGPLPALLEQIAAGQLVGSVPPGKVDRAVDAAAVQSRLQPAVSEVASLLAAAPAGAIVVERDPVWAGSNS